MAFTYEIDLKGNIASEAQKSAAAVKTLESALKATTNALTKADALGNVAGHAKLTQQSQMLSTALEQEKNKLAQLTPTASSAGSALSAIPWAQAAEGALAIVAAVGAATAALVAFAVKAADSKRTLLLQLEALTGSAKGASDLADAMDAVSSSGLATDEVVEKIGRSLAASGYKGEALKTALQNIATVGATAGEEAGAKIQGLYEKIAAGGGKVKLAVKALAGTGLEGVLKPGIVTADQLGQAIKTRFGDVAQRQMLGLSAQIDATKHNFGELFSDIDLTPLLEGLKSITSLLDQNTATGKMLKAVITDAFTAMGKVAAKVFPAIKVVILEIIISGLKMAIAFKPLASALGKLWDAMGGSKNASAALSVLVGMISVFTTGVVAAIGIVTRIINAFSAFTDVVKGAGGAAGNLIDSLVTGITGGAGKVIAAVKKLGSSVVGALKDALQMHSPSPLFIGMGNVGVGGSLAMGVEQSIPRVTGATKSLGAASIAGTAAGMSSGSKGGRGGMTVTIEKIEINGAGHDAQGITELMVSTTFERIGLAQGLG